MMYPILCKVKFEELNMLFKKKSLWKQLLFSFLVNWIVAPLIMVSTHLGIYLIVVSLGMGVFT